MVASRPVKVVHVGKFYPPVPGGIERIVQSLCTVTKGRLESQVLAFNTGRRTIKEEIDGVPVTRVGTWGSMGSVPVAPAFPLHLSRVDADVMILHEPNPWALLCTPPSDHGFRWPSGSIATSCVQRFSTSCSTSR